MRIRKPTRKDLILLGFVLFFFGFMGVWIINDSVACISNFGVNSTCGVGNGFWWFQPVKSFHIGLWLTILSMVFMYFLIIYCI